MATPPAGYFTATQLLLEQSRRDHFFRSLYNMPHEKEPAMRVLSTPSIMSRIRGELVSCSRSDSKPRAILLTHREMDELMSCRHFHQSVTYRYETDVTRCDPSNLEMRTVELYRRGQPYRFLVDCTFEGIPLCVTETPADFSLTRC